LWGSTILTVFDGVQTHAGQIISEMP